MKELLEKAQAIIAKAQEEKRSLTDAEKAEFQALEKQIEDKKIELRNQQMQNEAREFKFIEKNEFKDIYEDIKKGIIEKRNITLNGSGAINVVSGIVSAAIAKNSYINEYSYFYGENASTNIPVFSALPARPAGVAENVSNVSADTTAVLGITKLVPKPFVSLLPVTYSAVAFNKNFDASLKTIFAKVFADTINYQSLVGTSTNQFTGAFAATGTAVDCAAKGSPTAGDLLNLAITAAGKLTNPVIFINPSFISSIIATGDSDPISTELLMNRSVMGVRVQPTSYAPTTTTAGSIVAVAFDLPNYAVGIASEIIINPIRKAGDVNVYYQAEFYMNGAPVIAGDVYQLTTISGT